MKIQAPVRSAKEAKQVLAAGADEIYCGIIPEEWKKSYTNTGSMNRRQTDAAQFASIEELGRAADKAHEKGAKIYLTINEHYYLQDQYPEIKELAETAVEKGVDGLIVADIALLQELKGLKTKLCVSTGGACLNSESMEFYKECGAGRIILPRHLTIREIGQIARQKTVELETFILNEKCPNLDGYCTFQHIAKGDSAETAACRIEYGIEGEKGEVIRERLSLLKKGRTDCGACALFEFENLGIDSVKIVGRDYPAIRKIKDVRFIKKCLVFLEKTREEGEYKRYAKRLFNMRYMQKCNAARCYYPD